MYSMYSTNTSRLCCNGACHRQGAPSALQYWTRQSDTKESADGQQPITRWGQAEPPCSVWCPESCQGFGCVSIIREGSKGGYVCTMPNKTKKDKVSLKIRQEVCNGCE